jgi:hypothetical protein
MPKQIIKQPNGLWALWSSIVDDFILTDVTANDILEYYVEEYRADMANDISNKITQLNNGKKAYYQFTMTYEEAMERRRLNETEKMDKSD